MIQELAFLGLSYEVESSKPGQPPEKLKVLNGVSGQAKSKEMVALVSTQHEELVMWETF